MEKKHMNAKKTQSAIIVKTVFLTLLGVLVIGGIVFSYIRKNGMSLPVSLSVEKEKTPDNEVPFGDENLGDDTKYQQAMNEVEQTNLYTSPFGYTIKLISGWHVVDKLTFDNKDGKREAFSPYSDKEAENMLKTDPYNPNYYLEMEVRENPKNISLEEWTTNSKYSPQAVDQEEFDTTIGGLKAIKVIGNQGNAYVDYYVSANGNVYNLGYFYTTEEQWKSPPQVSVDAFETMIESFIPTK